MRDSAISTLGVTLAVCLACSFAVSASTVLLRPIQRENQRALEAERVREVLARQPALADLIDPASGARVEQRVVEVGTGTLVEGVDPATFDAKERESDPATSREIPSERDVAGLGRRANHAVVTVVRKDDAIAVVVLPVAGRGYASVIRAAVAVEVPSLTIVGLVVLEHGETPGLGSEIEEPDWRQQWVGKRIRDDAGALRIGIVEGEVPVEDRPFAVEAISGATRSSRGVGNGLRFALGEDGFGPFLDRIVKGEVR